MLSDDSLWVLQSFLAADTLRRVESQKLLQKVESQGRRGRVKSLELDPRLDRQ
jgi:hypothetical protein